jgi:hypothetical protein
MPYKIIRLNGYSVDYCKTADAVRDLIKHEGNLLNNRMSWLIQSETFLFAALSFAWDKSPILLITLSAVGICIAASIGFTSSVVSDASNEILLFWNNTVPAAVREKYVVVGLNRPSAGYRRHLKPWRALPWVFGIAWSVVALTALLGGTKFEHGDKPLLHLLASPS